jgi:hydroxyacylglutathione hydrolase
MQSEIRIIPLPMPLHMGFVNCYLIQISTGFVLIDTGSTNARTELHKELESTGCIPSLLKLIILTHGDLDHIGNAAYLRTKYGAKIAIHRDDSGMAERGDMFVNRKKKNIVIGTILPIVAGFGKNERFTPDILLDEGFDLSQFGFNAKVISLPGHSRGSIGILTSKNELFCGDLFENIKSPTLNALMDDSEAANTSVIKLRGLNIDKIYPGHGQPFTMTMLE